MPTWEEIGSTYLESIANSLPVHRALVASASILASISVPNQTHLSIAESIASIEVMKLFDLNSKPIQGITVLDLMLGVLLPFLGWLMYYMSTRAVFFLVGRGLNIEGRATSSRNKYPGVGSLNFKERLEEIDIIDKSLAKERQKLKTYSAFGETCFGIGVLFVICCRWGNALDAAIGIFLIGVGLITSGIALRLFFSEYYGTALIISHLQGKHLPSPNVS